MPRIGTAWVDVRRDDAARRGGLPRDVAGFSDQMAYASIESREAFLARAHQPWIVELRADLREILDPARATLSVGSGQGEHEVPLHLAGYEITASDLLDDALEDARRLFPGFRAIRLDVLDPPEEPLGAYDDLLVTGLDYALDDEQLRRFLRSARRILRPRGRVILVHRFRDTPVTRLLDRVLVPLWGLVRDTGHLVRRDGLRTVGRPRGWRRTGEEIRSLAAAEGFAVGRARPSLLGRELERVPTPALLMRAARRADRRWHWSASAMIFELHAS